MWGNEKSGLALVSKHKADIQPSVWAENGLRGVKSTPSRGVVAATTRKKKEKEKKSVPYEVSG